jgi:hypothetical protein
MWGANWGFISQKTTFFIVSAVKTSSQFAANSISATAEKPLLQKRPFLVPPHKRPFRHFCTRHNKYRHTPFRAKYQLVPIWTCRWWRNKKTVTQAILFCCVNTNGRSRVRLPMRSFDCFNLYNPPKSTMALKFAQLITDVSTRNLIGE